MHKLQASVLVVGLGIALLSGCGGGDSNDAGGSAATAVKARAYGSVADLRIAAVSAGYTCARWKQDNAVRLAAESGHCSEDDVFSTYASKARLNRQLETSQQLDQMSLDAGLKPNPYLVGPNWIINAPSVDTLRSSLGGTVVRSGE